MINFSFTKARRRTNFKGQFKNGFTLIETLIATFIFVIIAVTFYKAFGVMMDGVRVLRTKNTAANLANEQFEIVRNMAYDNIGIIGGLPSGVIPHVQNLLRDGVDFEVTTVVRNIDLPQDGTIGGTPNDSSPADQKLVEIEIDCEGCGITEPLVFSTNVSPLNLESTGDNGALFITVIDSNGAPIEDVDVSVETTYGTTSINLNDSTGINGMLQLVDVPPLINGYRIAVSKTGYSSEQTVSTSTPGKPDATVATGQVTNITFIIDKTATLKIASKDIFCNPVGNFDFNLKGSKLSGTEPKYDQDHTTSGSGNLTLSNFEWDTYQITGIDSSQMVIGTNPISPFSLNPGAEVDVDLIVGSKNLPALHVSVVDPSGLPISDADVLVEFDSGTNKQETTGRGSTTQTDWSGGGGQELIGDLGRYYSSDGNVSVLSPAGQLSLTGLPPSHSSSGYLESSTFDLGTTTEFHSIFWLPGSQLAETGANSVRFQIASNLELTPTSTWNFIGPSGGSGSYYESSGDSISSLHNGDRYLRYKAFLSTASTSFTPTVSDISFTYTTDCIPSGQVVFGNAPLGDATITVSKSGYNESTVDVTISTGWQSKQIILSPL